jgi:hypothetical protein
MSIANLRRVIARITVGTAIALAAFAGGAASASADTNSTGANPSPFSTLSCSCRETPPAGRKEEIDRGIQSGASAWSPGLPPPAQPGQQAP